MNSGHRGLSKELDAGLLGTGQDAFKGTSAESPREGGFSQSCGHNLPYGHLINYFLLLSPLATLKEERDRDKEENERGEGV